jgi:hypothetical protein
MAIENKSIVAIPQAVLAQITDLLNQATAAIQPYVTALTNEERRALPKMSDKTQAFVEKVVDYSITNSEFVPSYMDAADLTIDFGNTKGLSPVLQLAEQFCNNLNDTEMVAGSEAYISSLTYYNNVKQADKEGIPAARTIYADLQKRFPGRPRKKADVIETE